MPPFYDMALLGTFAENGGHSLLAAMAVPLVAVLLYPMLARLLLGLSLISEEERLALQENLPQLESNLASRLLAWNTGNRICNAAVVGCVPGFSFVLISDAMWRRLAPKSVAAIVAHEVGHLQLWHVPVRLSIVFAGGMLGLALVQQAEVIASWQIVAHGVALLTMVVYMVGMLHLVAPLLEFQADAFAIDLMTRSNGNRRQSARTLVRALSQLTFLAGMRPSQVAWLYPSFEQRRRVILCLSTSHRLSKMLRLALVLVVAGQWVMVAFCVLMICLR